MLIIAVCAFVQEKRKRETAARRHAARLTEMDGNLISLNESLVSLDVKYKTCLHRLSEREADLASLNPALYGIGKIKLVFYVGRFVKPKIFNTTHN